MKKLLLIALALSSATYVFAQNNATIERNLKDNTVTSIKFLEGEGPALNNSGKYINGLLELEDGYSWTMKFYNEMKEDMVVWRFDLLYKDLEVEHGSMSVVAKNDVISFVNANVFKNQHLSATPVLSEEKALDIALKHIAAKKYAWEDAKVSKLTKDNPSFQYPKASLVWVEDFSNDELDRQLHLAYKFDIYAQEPISRDKIYIDATTGDILLKDPVIKHVAASGKSIYSGTVNFQVARISSNSYEMHDSNRNVSTYDMQGGTNLQNANVFTSTNNTWPDGVAVDAHWGAGIVYDYFKNEHNRLSYDNLNSDLYSVVNYGNNYNNAFWNGFAMVYGNGTGMFSNGFEPLASLDVCAHEIGHGVCEYTSGLVYNRESGAMNEAFSDIWGAVIENYGDPNKQMWSIGEELRVGALRSMSSPNLFNDPDTYDGTHWVNVIGCTPNGGNDNCGVHTNSGVLNHWFYLLTVGGKGTNDKNNQFEVAGIGVKKAAEIAYGAEQVLTSTATYAECRTVTINFAATKYGACSREVEAVTRAWYAVGVGNPFSPCAPQVGFTLGEMTTNKQVAGTNCPAQKAIPIQLRITGNAPVGGNATVQIMGAGSAVSGADYNLPTSSITFNSGSTASKTAFISILDNGDVTKDKLIKLYTVITQNGSNLTQSYTYDTLNITLLGSRKEPDTGGNVAIRVGDADIKSKAITPFFSSGRALRNQFIITAAELRAAGVEPNTPISALEFNVSQKYSTQPFNNFTLKIATTNLTDLTSGIVTTTTQYYNGNFTTKLGWNRLPFTSTFTWNGTDNLAIETCFTNTTSGSNNDYILGKGTNTLVTAFVGTSSSANGCTLTFSSGYESISKPVIRLVQQVPTTEAEKIVVKSRQWEVHPAQNVYFRNDTNSKLIANISNASVETGCTDVAITKQGVGMTPLGAPFPMANRSVKEFAVTASNNGSTVAYDLTLFYDTSELSVTQLGNERLVMTTAAQDSLMDTSNTRIVVPTQASALNYYGFKGSLIGIGTRYFLIDRNITLPEPKSITSIGKNGSHFRVDNNPFSNVLYLSYSLETPTTARIKMFDVTGKEVFATEKAIINKQGQLTMNVGGSLASGVYFVQIQTVDEAVTYKVLKQ